MPLSGIAPPHAPRKAPARRWLAGCAAAATGLVLCEGALRALTVRDPSSGMETIRGYVLLPYVPPRTVSPRPYAAYVAPDPDLGWSLVPNGRTLDGRYEANAEGVRAPRGVLYAAARPHRGLLRVVTVGDSFTHGDGVGYEQTWQRTAERLRPDLEMINLGVPGYGTDQAYLRWMRDGARLRPDVAVLGIWPENICRNLNVVRALLQPAEAPALLSKPRFVLEGGRLQLRNVPAVHGQALADAIASPAGAALLRDEHWAIAGEQERSPWHRSRLARAAVTVASLRRRQAMRARLYSGEDPSGIRLTAAIAAAFRDHARRSGAVPVVAIFPMADLLEGDGSRPLAEGLRSRGLDPIDLGPPMARAVAAGGRGRFYQPDGHLTAEGNALIAGALAARLPQAPVDASWARHHFMSTKSDHGRDQ